ncbi:hypothetical protein [Pseudomonas fluvialis]|uniref:hypothetical protein n=1 Tax=Pseudomonas fluvialis TaxID=1793966 RepID=UPI0012FF1695|nr:hypothetical protein [Pseudomonas pharmacofabricae]
MARHHAVLTNNSPGTRWGFSLKRGISGIIGIFSNPKGKTVSDISHIGAEIYPIYSTYPPLLKGSKSAWNLLATITPKNATTLPAKPKNIHPRDILSLLKDALSPVIYGLQSCPVKM